MKQCIKCSEIKPIQDYHKHKGMKDGHLNKCRYCVKKDVDNWRLNNPDGRKQENNRRREKLGYSTREEYFTKRKENAKGRKASSLQYANKRRLQIENMPWSDFDEFVFTEAVRLREQRKEITGFDWHIDHIVPINSKTACGLHNAHNLQVVPASWNVKKGNRNFKTYFSGY